MFLYALRNGNFIFVGVASCHDNEPVAAGCRSYKKHGVIESNVFYLIKYAYVIAADENGDALLTMARSLGGTTIVPVVFFPLMQSHQTRHDDYKVHLAADRFGHSQRTRRATDRYDVTVPHGGHRYKAEIDRMRQRVLFALRERQALNGKRSRPLGFEDGEEQPAHDTYQQVCVESGKKCARN
ncbi:hypothetical protein DSTSK_36160 [Desulforhabdus sp. TSK]|nr:hypothetical protein [Desulforhabdus sp. TSK]GKT10311.1 hypothetical protein DSTSK_36160 [Desulforhabdus sp. TSK]